MNILPKKRWHVRTKQNIERVRRDEAQAAEEEKELKRKIQLAEQEARTEFLRKKAKVSGEEPKEEPKEENSYETKSNTSIYNDKDKHVNFFRDIEDSGGYIGGTNKEHEAEEKAKKEKYEKDIGLLTYLGQSSIEAKGQVPWYLKSSSKDLLDEDEKKDEEKSKKQKDYLDPLKKMNKYLNIKKKKSDVFEMKPIKDKDPNETKTSDSSNTQNMTIEILRAKRLKREEDERRRSQEFLRNLRGEKTSKPEVIYDDRRRKYNSQYNPHLARNSAKEFKAISFVKPTDDNE